MSRRTRELLEQLVEGGRYGVSGGGQQAPIIDAAPPAWQTQAAPTCS